MEETRLERVLSSGSFPNSIKDIVQYVAWFDGRVLKMILESVWHRPSIASKKELKLVLGNVKIM